MTIVLSPDTLTRFPGFHTSRRHATVHPVAIVPRVSGDETPDAEPDAPGDEVPPAGASQRARLAIVGGATVLLAAIVGIVVATGGSDEPPGAPTGVCFEAWNEDPIAPLQDGTHAYSAHGYRQTLVTRLDREGEIVDDADDDAPADDPDARCAVIFASPQPDFEPDFGVRVYDEGRWTGLALADKAPLDDDHRPSGRGRLRVQLGRRGQRAASERLTAARSSATSSAAGRRRSGSSSP